jgi:hypothetical protein
MFAGSSGRTPTGLLLFLEILQDYYLLVGS